MEAKANPKLLAWYTQYYRGPDKPLVAETTQARTRLEELINEALPPGLRAQVTKTEVFEDGEFLREVWLPFQMGGFKIKIFYGSNIGVPSGLNARQKETVITSKVNQAICHFGPWGVF